MEKQQYPSSFNGSCSRSSGSVDLPNITAETTLKPIEHAQVIKLSENWLQHQLQLAAKPKTDSDTSIENAEFIEHQIACATHQYDAYSQGRITKPFQAGIRIFLESYIRFAHDKLEGSDQAARNDILRMIHSVDQQLFSLSPNITEFAGDYVDRIEIAAQALEVPELHGTLVAHIVSELNYELNYTNQPETHLAKLFVDTSSIEALNKISILEAIGNEAAANGGWSDASLQAILRTLQDQTMHPSPLVEKYAQVTLQKLSLKDKSPSLDVVRKPNNPNYARRYQPLTSQQVKDHGQLVHNITLPEGLPAHSKLVYLANDAIAMVDQGNIPYRVAFVDRSQFTEGSIYNQAALFQLQLLCKQPDQIVRQDWPQILDYIQRHIIVAQYPSAAHNPHMLAAAWHEMFPSISENDWENYLHNHTRVLELQELANQISEEKSYTAAIRNQELSDAANDNFYTFF